MSSLPQSKGGQRRTKEELSRIAARNALIAALFWMGTLMASEEPKFELLRTEGEIEIRRYGPVIVAETIVDGDMDSASSRGFRLIADYIFGNNEPIAMAAPVIAAPQTSTEKIAMTVPVTIEPQGAEGRMMAGAQRWRLHFVMPRQYTLATLPKPRNPLVQVRKIPTKTFGALRYSGSNTESTLRENTESLLIWLKAQQIETIGPPQLARYNPPWTLPFLRRNEILQEIKTH